MPRATATAIVCCPRFTPSRIGIGWISAGALNYVALRLDVAPAEIYGVASFYGMFSLEARPKIVAHICDDIACVTRGSSQLCGELEKTLGPAGKPCAEGKAVWLRSACLGLCERAPAVLISSAGEKSHERVLAPASLDAVVALVENAIQEKLPAEPDELEIAAQRSASHPGKRILLAAAPESRRTRRRKSRNVP